MVITTPDLAPGFQLAGAEAFAVESAGEAERVLQELVEGVEASLDRLSAPASLQALVAARLDALTAEERRAWIPAF
jgi:hypothetical protein